MRLTAPRPRLWAAAALLTWVGGACAGADTAPVGFEITDSAGVTLVRNPAEPESSTAPRLVPDLRIGVVEGEPEYQLGDIRDVAEGREGEIYVLEDDALEVRVFDSEGKHLRTLGRAGDGPGEFRRPSALRVGAGDTLHVLESASSSGRLHVFALDGSFVRTSSASSPGVMGATPAITAQGDVVAEVLRSASGLPNLLIRIDGRTAAIDTLLELEPARGAEAPLQAPQPRWTMFADGGLVIGRTDEYRFVYLNSDQEVDRVVTRAVFPRLLTEAEKNQLLAYQRAIFARFPPAVAQRMSEGLTVADLSAVYSDVMAGPEGSLWVMKDDPAEWEAGTQTWDVLDAEGRHLGSVQAGAARSWTAGNHLYQMVVDELGVPYLQRYRIEWGDGG